MEAKRISSLGWDSTRAIGMRLRRPAAPRSERFSNAHLNVWCDPSGSLMLEKQFRVS